MRCIRSWDLKVSKFVLLVTVYRIQWTFGWSVLELMPRICRPYANDREALERKRISNNPMTHFLSPSRPVWLNLVSFRSLRSSVWRAHRHIPPHMFWVCYVVSYNNKSGCTSFLRVWKTSPLSEVVNVNMSTWQFDIIEAFCVDDILVSNLNLWAHFKESLEVLALISDMIRILFVYNSLYKRFWPSLHTKEPVSIILLLFSDERFASFLAAAELIIYCFWVRLTQRG